MNLENLVPVSIIQLCDSMSNCAATQVSFEGEELLLKHLTHNINGARRAHATAPAACHSNTWTLT